MKSLGYYLLANVIKLKGVKKIFPESPINYLKLRNDDVHSPSKRDVQKNRTDSFLVGKTTVTEVIPEMEISPEKALIYCPGGAFVYGPTEPNWNSIGYIVKKSGIKAYVLDYPKAPENSILAINENIWTAYHKILENHSPENVILIGDSVGGTIMSLLVQSLLENKPNLVPRNIILISPVMDCSLDNPEIGLIDKMDIMLSKAGALSAKQMCAGGIHLKSPKISPLFGQINGFIPTLLFIAENDIMRPDAEFFAEKLKASNVKLELVFGKDMPHIWPILPVLGEGKLALNQIVGYIHRAF